MNNGGEKVSTLGEMYRGVFGGDARARLETARAQAASADAKLAALSEGFAQRIASLRRDLDALGARLSAVAAKAKALSKSAVNEVIREHACIRTERIEAQQWALATMTDDLDALATGLASEIHGLFSGESEAAAPAASLAQALLAALPGLQHAATLTEACGRLSAWLDDNGSPRETLLRLRQFKAFCDLLVLLDEHGLDRLQDIAAQRDEEAAVLGSHLESHESVTRRLENDLFFLEQGKVLDAKP